MGNNKLKLFVFCLVSFLIGMVLSPHISSFILNFVSKIKEYELLGNMVDLIGNIVVAFMSAAIAYIVSNSQAKKHNDKEKMLIENESQTYFRMLKIELGTHKTLISNIVDNMEKEYEDCIKDLSYLNREIWDNHADKLHADSETLEKLYKYYLSLSSLKDLSNEELELNEREYLKVHLRKVNQAIDYLSEKIKPIS